MLLANAILQATDAHQGYSLTLEVSSDWFLWTNRQTFYLAASKSFSTPPSSYQQAGKDTSFFYRFFDQKKIAMKLNRYGCVFCHR
jgi:hypothetical protein